MEISIADEIYKMYKKIKGILKRKHIVVIGKTKKERHQFINKIVEYSNFETHRFPIGMKDFYEYIEYVKKNSLFSPSYSSRGKWNFDQVYDFHQDWMIGNNCLVVMEELQEMEAGDYSEILGLFLDEIKRHKKGDRFIHLLISQENENGLIEKLIPYIYLEEKENRTTQQIVEGSFEFIDLDFL